MKEKKEKKIRAAHAAPVEKKKPAEAKRPSAETKRQPAEAKKRPAKAKSKAPVVILTVVLVLLALAAVGATLAGRHISTSDTNLPNVYVGEIYVGGMTKEETRAELERQQWDKSVSAVLTVKLPMDTSFRVDYTRAGANLTADRAAEAAYRYGHDGNWFENLLTYVRGVFAPVDVSGEKLTLDKEYITKLMNAGIESFGKSIADKDYAIDDENSLLVLTKGAGQLSIDADALYELVADALLNKKTELVYTLPETQVTMPDFQALHEELAASPADAYYDKESDTIVPDVKGVDFDVNQAESLWNEAGLTETVEIPVQLTNPQITEESLKELLFRDKLGEKTTYYWGSTAQRINNIDLVVNKLNGLVLMPGEEFSYNGYVGQRTEAAGFQAAAAYNDGQVVSEVGGGICQVSSTLYYVTMAANLETVERTCHYFAVGYLDKGLDATVSWPGPDFKFKNNREYPIKIIATSNHDSSALTIEIWGSNIDGTYVEPRSYWWASYDSTYPDVQTGWGAFCQRYLFDKDGNLLEKIDEAGSIYHLHDEDIKWPTEPEEPSPSDGGGDGGGGTDTGGDSGGGDSGGGDSGGGDVIIVDG